MSLLSLKGVHKSYGSHIVLQGIDIELKAGECFGLLGPNGAGKTTTLRLALGLTHPQAGSIHLMGHDVLTHARLARQQVGVVAQTDNLDPDFTLRENLLVYGRYFDISRQILEARIPGLLDFAGLSARADERIQSLSGGMKRRLTLARALINDPQIVFLDEPTTGLDPQARHLIWDRLRQLTQNGKSLLLTTHFMEEAERLCDRIAIIDQGKIITEGSPQQLIRDHIEPQVVELYGEGAAAWAHAKAARLCERFELTGGTVFCYANDAKALLCELNRGDFTPGLRFLLRPASLEDVFLKLTGRDLRD
jgi:lipooligosaccharide transport system ATP-binding protein